MHPDDNPESRFEPFESVAHGNAFEAYRLTRWQRFRRWLRRIFKGY